MAAALRIKLADLLMIMASDISLRPAGRSPKARGPTQFKLTQFKPDVRPVKTVNPNAGSQIDDEELKGIQRYLRGGPASREDLEFAFNMSNSAILRRLNFLRRKGTVVLLTDNTYALQEALR